MYGNAGKKMYLYVKAQGVRGSFSFRAPYVYTTVA
jgi:hypothetical protein